ncbi:universal stress protein [Lutibacter citreus]|uniref:universal stress protein n=1 Tax=Lutibacter citreus TaxID=2138210 RepID=UPI000DBE507C|nr:universal stress protein [Lutibacter citreus]
MKRILCATDYSKNAITALKYAFAISDKLNASLLITHVFDYPTILETEVKESNPNLEGEAFKQEQLKLNKFCKLHLGDELNSKNVSTEVIENTSVVNGIIDKADDINAFMIVVGMKGKSFLKDLILGNTSRQLIDKSHCLVLAIPEDTYYNEIKTIVYATDFDLKEDVEVIEKLSGIAKAFDAKIEVVHISKKNEFGGEIQMNLFEDTLKNSISYDKIGFKVLYSEDIFDSLRVYLGDVNADMVIMLEREKSGFFNNLFHQDLVKKMELYGKVPLISFNENNFGLLHFLKFY